MIDYITDAYVLRCPYCGSVVRSFVKEPEKLLKLRDRRR